MHWTMLRAPFFLAIAHIGSLLFVTLKLFLQHVRNPLICLQCRWLDNNLRLSPQADKTPATSPRAEFLLDRVPPTTVEDLTRPPQAPKKVRSMPSPLSLVIAGSPYFGVVFTSSSRRCTRL